MRFEYQVKMYLIYTDEETCYRVYAMDTQDAMETLLINEPSITVNDIQLVEEHRCAKKEETIH